MGEQVKTDATVLGQSAFWAAATFAVDGVIALLVGDENIARAALITAALAAVFGVGCAVYDVAHEERE